MQLVMKKGADGPAEWFMLEMQAVCTIPIQTDENFLTVPLFS